jgi:hypothetical protein
MPMSRWGAMNGRSGAWKGSREAVDYCGFRDLSYSGLPYTWDNRLDGTANIKVRLDRALANVKWLDMFGDSVVLHMQMIESNHCALLVRMCSTGAVHLSRPRK